MGMVFFRIRKFAEGFVEGFMEGIEKIKSVAVSIAEFFSPLIEGGKTLLNMLGLFKPIAETQVDSWTQFGKAIGEVIPYVIALFGAFKALGMAKSIIGGISSALSLITANPIMAVIVAAIALFTYLYTHFEGFRDFVNAIISRIVNIFSGAFEFIKGLCNVVIGALTLDWEKFSGGVKSILSGLKTYWGGIWNALVDIIKPILNGLVAFIKGIVNLIAAPFIWLGNLISSNWEGLVSGIKFLLNGFVSFIKVLVNLILAPFKWLINLLTGNWGGFIDGAKAAGEGFKTWWDSWTLKDIFAPLGDLAVGAINGIKSGFSGVISWFEGLSLPNIFASVGDWATSAAEKAKGIWTGFCDFLSSLNPFSDWSAPTPPKEEVEAGKQEMIEKYGTLDLTPSYMRAPTPPVENVKPDPLNMMPSYMRGYSQPATNKITEHIEKTASVNTITNNNSATEKVKELTNNTVTNNNVTERVEKTAGTNTITNNNLKEVTNNTIAGASEKIIERNNTQELQLLPQAPVTQNIQQLMPLSTREVIMQSAPINEVQPLWQSQANASGSPAIQAAIGNLPTNTVTEHVEKIAGTNTVTNNNTTELVKEVTNNNNITAGATERIIERNNTQELQLLSQPPVIKLEMLQKVSRHV